MTKEEAEKIRKIASSLEVGRNSSMVKAFVDAAISSLYQICIDAEKRN